MRLLPPYLEKEHAIAPSVIYLKRNCDALNKNQIASGLEYGFYIGYIRRHTALAGEDRAPGNTDGDLNDWDTNCHARILIQLLRT